MFSSFLLAYFVRWAIGKIQVHCNNIGTPKPTKPLNIAHQITFCELSDQTNRMVTA